MTRRLYIVQSHHISHGSGNTPLTKFEDALSQNIMGNIARLDDVDSMFQDGINEEAALEINEALDDFLGFPEDKVREFLLENEDEDGASSLRVLYELRKEGYTIGMQRTERDDVEDDYKILTVAMERYPVFAERIQKEIGSVDDVLAYMSRGGYSFQEMADVRDETVFDNVNRLAGERSILFMGVAHKLREFDTAQHDFEIYRVTFTSDAEKLSFGCQGNLPSVFKETMSDIEEELNLISIPFENEMTYSNTNHP
jgi:hypothetical protein